MHLANGLRHLEGGEDQAERPGTMTARTLKLYIDYKSPYAYLAKDPAYDLERETGVRLEWLPYTLDIPSFLGSARVNAEGVVEEEGRNQHQWRRVRYSYMDCRREANRRGLTILGPKKIFDSSLANIGLLYAKRQGVFRAYNDLTFERFWKRELDIEQPNEIAAVLAEAGADATDFAAFAADQGRRELKELEREAQAAGVFGVPSFLLEDGDLYWGREHLPHLQQLLSRRTGPHPA
jgi:2-hydroxychromene-2-carboxylate isomerase